MTIRSTVFIAKRNRISSRLCKCGTSTCLHSKTVCSVSARYFIGHMGLIELYAGATLPDGFKDTAPYIVLLIMLVVRPQGLFGTPGRKKV